MSEPAATAVPDWAPLRAAILSDDPNARRLARIREIEGWLVLPWHDAAAACVQASPTLAQAREINALLNVVLMSLRREVGIVNGPAGAARFNEVMQAAQAGTLPEHQRRIWERANTAYGLWAAQRQHDPAVAELPSPSAGEAAARAALAALIERQQAAQAHAIPGAATPERMEALEAVVADYRVQIAAADPGTPLHVDLCFWAAHAAYAQARGWGILGRNERAARLYAEAAVLYRQGDRPVDAQQSAELARQLGVSVEGDLGAASRQDLRDLVERDADPLARARAQGRLCALARSANDPYDACEWADQAIANLVRAGFDAPQAQGVEALCDGWVRRACQPDAAAGALPLLLEIGNLYQGLLGARHARWAAAEPAQALAIEAALDTLHAALHAIAAQPGIARDAVMAGLARYLPDWVPDDSPTADADADALLARAKALGARLAAIKQEANVADAARDLPALQALIVRAGACVADAQATRLAPTIGLACQTDAYVRLRAADPAGAAASALAGEAVLLDGQSPAPHELAGHPQFDLLLELRGVRLQSLLMQVDNDGLLALARETVQLVEARRWQVADPYQRGAFLASRTLFYEMAVLACYRLQRWDELLGVAELVKSRGALLDRLAARRSQADPALLARLGAVNAQLATAPAGGSVRAAALEQRRLLLGLLAVEGRAAAALDDAPAVSVDALQAALAADEAIVAWVWVSPSVVLVLAIGAAGLHAERVLLGADELALLADHVALVRGNGVTVRAFDAMVSRLAGVFLPPATRAFVAPARRLVLSPHRALHLLPFHAAQFDGRFLVEQAALRYVPNLASLLLPARDASGAPAPARVLALGIGEFAVPGQAWAALAAAEDEARAVAAAWARHDVEPELLLGPQAGTAALGARLADGRGYRCLHLATHASSVFEDSAADDPFAARLVLQDGSIDALTVSQWRLSADVVVLSACDSGQRALGGRGLAELPGDDLFGLQAALFEAGAQSVVGALWPVDDRVAPAIMSRLHDGLAAGVAPDLALQAAVLQYLSQPDARRRIYFWAPLFVTSLGRLAGAQGQENHRA